ncbi:hypothetical protein RHMOL_Rhmol10G0149700 [Rhododendron molle]|uniref:Uncharacterized protein n=1 Tax=Rhododendron molle TaxID=49168 RepID=A0ACC0M2N9_RHOML|nr:hypothetical protein RHMOL_Rhmol10G0149700 [Rhododendron molle]
MGVPPDTASRFRNHHSDLRTPYNTYPDLESHFMQVGPLEQRLGQRCLKFVSKLESL